MELRKIETSQNVLTLLLTGDLDASGSKKALPHIDEVLFEDNHPEIEVDMKHVSFLDSSGVGAIVYFYKRLVEKERHLRIKNASGQPLEIFSLLRIGNAIPINSKH
ncbi:STAS domain-containing protein [Vibrio sp. HN007]|uniref:STAS domain-containing protein n=1 Tax=Vibrio iocasae TaxID=3098914 RepID=UPI0035D45308